MNRKETLKAAKRCVCGEREEDYGNPENNFAIIAKLWSLWLEKDISAHDVAIMMTLLKISRVKSGQYKDDNYTDICGYAACAAEIAGESPQTDENLSDYPTVKSPFKIAHAHEAYNRWISANGCYSPRKMKKIQCGSCLLNTLCFGESNPQKKMYECRDLPTLKPYTVIDAVEKMLAKIIKNPNETTDYAADDTNQICIAEYADLLDETDTWEAEAQLDL